MNTLTYRSGKDSAGTVRIITRIRNRHAGFFLRIFAKLAIGIPLSFLGPAIISGFLDRMFHRAGMPNTPSWMAVFALSSLIIVPILYWIEWHYHGDYFLEEARAQGITMGESYRFIGSYSNWRMENPDAVVAFYLEILLFAPKQVFSAIADLRQRIKLSDDELGRAARIVFDLLSVDGGITLDELRREGESPVSFQRVLRYLRFHDWIDISKHGDRVWLISTARKWLK